MQSATQPSPFTRAHVAAAWGVHVYTALGLALGLASLDALWRGDAATFLLFNLLAVFIDFMAKQVYPGEAILLYLRQVRLGTLR